MARAITTYQETCGNHLYLFGTTHANSRLIMNQLIVF